MGSSRFSGLENAFRGKRLEHIRMTVSLIGGTSPEAQQSLGVVVYNIRD
jgi:hypothetical protein